VELTAAELRRAQSILTEWKGYRPGDDRFIRPLLKDIRMALDSDDVPVPGKLPPPIDAKRKEKQVNGGSQ
jgi:hypothetical protein